MAVYNGSISVKTRGRSDLVNITPELSKEIKKSNISDGIAVVFSKHTTCGILIQELESGLNDDILKTINKVIPQGAGYKHDRIDDNADSHIRTCIIGSSETIPIINGSLQLGTWQAVFLAEFDGPRTRTCLIEVIGD